jgi:hypothetical protein
MASDGRPSTEPTAPDPEDEREITRARQRPKRPNLVSRTVQRPNAPDRTTVYPTETTGVPRMSTWMSVDACCLVNLDAFR